MEDAVLLPDSMQATGLDSSLELDLMDELLADVWLEGAGFLQQGTTTYPNPFDSSHLFSPFFEIQNRISNQSPEAYAKNGSVEKSSSYSDPPQVDEEIEVKIGTRPNPCSRDFTQYQAQASEPTSWSVRPRALPDPISSLKERLARTLSYIKESYRDCDVLVQIWVPMNSGDRRVLTTYGQPFSLNSNCQRLANYRIISAGYQFSAQENSKEALGLPGRVFLGKVPEWSPDVRYFRNYEYARVNYAQRYDVRGTLAIPIFQHGSRICLGVMEVVMTSERINWRSDLEYICNALQAVDLDGSEVLTVPRVKMKNDSYLAALPEISMVVRKVCQVHGLPLAQTWIPCIQQGKSGTRHSDESYRDCVSTVDVSCYVNDPFLSGFHEACSEHHLLRGQGIVGKAFTTNQPCFSSDIATFSKMDYPLSHHARIFGLRAAVAIRLRSVHTGKADFVLEFFLPKDCLMSEEQKIMLNSLSATLQQVCQSLRVVTPKELEDERVVQVSSQLLPEESHGKKIDGDNGRQEGRKILVTPSVEASGSEHSWVTNIMEAQEKKAVRSVSTSLEFGGQEPHGSSMSQWDSYGIELPEDRLLPDFKAPSHQDAVKTNNESASTCIGRSSLSTRDKTIDKKHTKTEKIISLQLLRQYFAGSLKDAAKSLGVCPTTLKRICRQHGISRWPSRKIKKVGHSLRKLQVVINSVQGVDATFHLSSLYGNFPKSCGSDLSIQIGSGKSSICKPKQDDDPESSNAQHCLLTSHASASNSLSSSCSHASSSSHSSGVKKHKNAAKFPIKVEVSSGENQNDMLKRASSELNLHPSSQETPGNLARSQSLKSLGENSSPVLLSSPCQNRGTDGQLRVKAMYGEEKIRLSLQPNWGIQELKQEIAKRFDISNMNLMDLKYLDDDSEWVLLTCDSDLQECIDIYRSSHMHTVKILVHHAALPSAMSFGSGL